MISLGFCWIDWYNAESTVSGDPAVGRYAGCGGGSGFLAFRRSSSGGKADIFERRTSFHLELAT